MGTRSFWRAECWCFCYIRPHFRRGPLEAVGAWDPFNVTEDADIGVRLARAGYRTETIRLPTREEGPRDLSTWLPQRTRWFKGWLMTWLVHMRDPVALARALGPSSFLICQILFIGLLVSAIAHPIMLATAAAAVAELAFADRPSQGRLHQLLLVDAVSIVSGYCTFLLLGWQALAPSARRGFWKAVLFTPVYWLLMSVAAVRAIDQLRRRPHHWAKTHHPRPTPPGVATAAAAVTRSVAAGNPVLAR